MHAVYVMVFGALLSLGAAGTFDDSYKALQQDGVSAAATALLASTRVVLRAQDQSAVSRERDLYRASGRPS